MSVEFVTVGGADKTDDVPEPDEDDDEAVELALMWPSVSLSKFCAGAILKGRLKWLGNNDGS